LWRWQNTNILHEDYRDSDFIVESYWSLQDDSKHYVCHWNIEENSTIDVRMVTKMKCNELEYMDTICENEVSLSRWL
jgi:phosphoenolpyruvate carboxylase